MRTASVPTDFAAIGKEEVVGESGGDEKGDRIGRV